MKLPESALVTPTADIVLTARDTEPETIARAVAEHACKVVAKHQLRRNLDRAFGDSRASRWVVNFLPVTVDCTAIIEAQDECSAMPVWWRLELPDDDAGALPVVVYQIDTECRPGRHVVSYQVESEAQP